MGILTSLDAVRDAQRIIDGMRLADELAFEASRDGGVRTIRVLSSVLDDDDQLVAIAATHALAQVYDAEADRALSRQLSHERPFIREHAAWALSTRLPRIDAIGRLVAMVAEGGFSGMIAQRTLEQWTVAAGDYVGLALEGALLGVEDAAARSRIVETLGLVRTGLPVRALRRIAADEGEHLDVRVAAVAALGQRPGDADIAEELARLARGEGFLADAARLSLVDVHAPRGARPSAGPGITVGQLFLHADIDAGLSHAGRGDNGGIATLLVRLGNALVEENGVDRVLTMCRGSVEAALDSVASLEATRVGHEFGAIPLLSDPVQAAAAWPLRVAARRGIRRLLRASGGVDVLHLRMADVGSLAAADVARELDIPVVFTVAPDPHAVINSLDLAGELTRATLGEVDESEHFWFRTRLVQQLAGNAAHTVLFPRPELRRDMSELVGIDITAHPERHSVVPEGIDLGTVDRAVAEAADHAAGRPATPPLLELEALLGALDEPRRGLPLIVSVGRFHRVKGMATIVEAWATSPLADRANLLLIGGDLESPSADELEQLTRMDAIVPPQQRAARGLLLPGHRSNDTVARWVAAARFGLPGLAAPRGVYVCGSLKEEFGIALLEAMASGLIVVAPDGGGPATYVQQGRTGFLAPTWNVGRLADAAIAALDAAAGEGDDERAVESRATVERGFTIQAMARSLAEVYDRVHDEDVAMRGWAVPAP